MALLEEIFKRVFGSTPDGDDSPSAIKVKSTSDTTEEAVRTTAIVGPAVSGDPSATEDSSSETITTTERPTLTRTTKTTVTHPTETSSNKSVETNIDDTPPMITNSKGPTTMDTGDFTFTVTDGAVSESSTLEVAPVSDTTPAFDPTDGFRSIPTDSLQTTPTDGFQSIPTDSSQTVPAGSSETSSVPAGANEGETAPLPTTTIVGIAVGSGTVGLAAIFLLFYFILRHRRSKRGSSVRAASSPKYDDDKFVGTGTSLSQPTALSKSASELNQGDDVFAPFGGRANSQRGIPNPLLSNPPTARGRMTGSSTRSRMSAADTYMNSPSSATSSNQPMYSNVPHNNAIGEEAHAPEIPRPGQDARSAVAKEITMVRPESQPRCIEVDSPGNSVPELDHAAISELPTPTPPPTHPNSGSSQAQTHGPPRSRYHDARSRLGSMAQNHPSSLIPGPAGTQRSIQSRMEDDAMGRSEQGDAHDGQGLEFRPNLNLTEDELEKNQHVTSWEKL